jgi:hypothetical protein
VPVLPYCMYDHVLYLVPAIDSLLCDRSAERVDDIMEKVEDEQDLMNQISEAISRPADDMFDDVSSRDCWPTI